MLLLRFGAGERGQFILDSFLYFRLDEVSRCVILIHPHVLRNFIHQVLLHLQYQRLRVLL